MPAPLRPFLKDLEAYTPGEQPKLANLVKLNTNECPWPPSPKVAEELARCAENLHRYPDPRATGLCRALAAYHGLEPGQVLAGNGSDEILRLLVHAAIEPGEAIAVVEPSYSLYPVLAASFEGRTTSYPLEDRERLPAALNEGPEPLLFLPNPNPPLGTFYERAELAELCRARAPRLVVIDEAYVDFAPRDAVSLLAEFENIVVTRTFSKSFSLAGMRVGYLLGAASLVEQLMKIKDSYNLSAPAQAAASAALADVALMHKRAGEIRRLRDKTAEGLRALGYRVPASQGNFLFPIHAEAERHFRALRERGILVRYFNQPALRDGYRVTVGSSDQMQRLLEALADIV